MTFMLVDFGPLSSLMTTRPPPLVSRQQMPPPHNQRRTRTHFPQLRTLRTEYQLALPNFQSFRREFAIRYPTNWCIRTVEAATWFLLASKHQKNCLANIKLDAYWVESAKESRTIFIRRLGRLERAFILCKLRNPAHLFLRVFSTMALVAALDWVNCTYWPLLLVFGFSRIDSISLVLRTASLSIWTRLVILAYNDSSPNLVSFIARKKRFVTIYSRAFVWSQVVVKMIL